MWPFKKRKRFVIMNITNGTYFSGVAPDLWVTRKSFAMHLDRDSARNLEISIAIAAIGGRGNGNVTTIED